MQLVERQLISLDDPVVHHLPYFNLSDPRSQHILIRHMVTHTSGLPDVDDYQFESPPPDCAGGYAAERYVRSLRDLEGLHSLGLVDKAGLVAAPGDRYRYSNLGFDVLGDLISKVSGELDFGSYVSRFILSPLRMDQTTTSVYAADPDLLAVPHVLSSFDDATLQPRKTPLMAPAAIYPDNCIHAPSSDVTSNGDDMAKYMLMQLRRGVSEGGAELIGERVWDQMMRPLVNISQHSMFERSIGVAWYQGDFHGLATLHHDGEDDGFLSQLVLIPSCGVGVLWMSNGDDEAVATQDAIDNGLSEITKKALETLLAKALGGLNKKL